MGCNQEGPSTEIRPTEQSCRYLTKGAPLAMATPSSSKEEPPRARPLMGLRYQMARCCPRSLLVPLLLPQDVLKNLKLTPSPVSIVSGHW